VNQRQLRIRKYLGVEKDFIQRCMIDIDGGATRSL